VVTKLESLLEGIPGDTIQPLSDNEASDAADWARYIEPNLGKNWLEVPWFFAENYFYRRILDITGYFQQGPYQARDPFLYQKRQGLEKSHQVIRSLSSQVNQSLSKISQRGETLADLLAVDLWGNQADLSMWPGGEDIPNHQDTGQQREHTLVDDSEAIVDYLFGVNDRAERIDFLLDNVGLELVSDLLLAAFLLEQNLVERIYLHAKVHPTFVSDAMIEDVQQTVNFLLSNDDREVTRAGQLLSGLLENGRLQLQAHRFWTSPLEMWQMPASLKGELDRSNLLISKGDANYRRLLGDRHWPYTTPFADIVCYLSAPVVALRTLKSEVAAGLSPGQPEEVTERDPEWLSNGRWGVIQYNRSR
jgi:uncharacterized protein with ATP-grasp and redox domains